MQQFLCCPNCWHLRWLGINEDTLTFRKPTLISVGTVLPWKVRMMVAIVIVIFCASLAPCSFRISAMSSMGVNFSSMHQMTPLMLFSVLWGGGGGGGGGYLYGDVH